MRPAEARFKASIMIKSSRILELTGVENGWMTKVSRLRTLSRILTKVFSLENWKTWQLPSGMPRYSTTALARAGWAFPVKTFISSMCVSIQDNLVGDAGNREPGGHGFNFFG